MRHLAVRDLQLLFGAEPNLARAFATLARRADNRKLRTFCKEGVTYTRRRVTRIKRALRLLSAPAKPISSLGLDGLVRDAQRAAGKQKGPLTDVALLATIERISHYGLAAYTTLDRYLRGAGAPEARRILSPCIKEKREAISEMSAMARRQLLPRLGK
jgi:ferritin-like metal-binding protein YciE